MYSVYFTRKALKDKEKLQAAHLGEKARELVLLLQADPFRIPPPFERLVGDLAGAYSRRINIQHRLVYQVLPKENAVKVLRMWSHYE